MKKIQNDKFNCANAGVFEGRLGFYIIADDRDFRFYLHSNGNVYNGVLPAPSGYFESQEAAQRVLDKAKEVFCAKGREN